MKCPGASREHPTPTIHNAMTLSSWQSPQGEGHCVFTGNKSHTDKWLRHIFPSDGRMELWDN